MGYPHVERTSTGIHDPLFVSAACLENNGSAVLVISLDVLFLSGEWVRDCREVITRSIGIPGEAILIGATHTHSGPHTVNVLAWQDDPVVPPVDQTFLARLREQTLAAATDAWNKRLPARAAWCQANVQGIAGGNRIDPRGAEDPEAGLLFVRRHEDDRALCVVSVYGMHPTVLHEDSTLFSSDFIAFTRQTVESAFPGLGMVYLNGVCGNQSPRRVVTAQTFAEAERIGSALGERMVQALSQADGFKEALPVSFKTCQLRLEGKTFPSVEEAEANLHRVRSHYQKLKDSQAAPGILRTAECTVFGAEEVLTLAKAEMNGEADLLRQAYRRAEVQVLRIGDACLAAWPGEFFVEYGLDAKRRSEIPLFVATIANGDLQGYVVTPLAEAAGGYEAQMSLFPASVGQQFVDTTLALVKKLS